MQRLDDMVKEELALTEDDIDTHTDCVLGQWYYEHGRIKSGNLQEYSALEKPHKLLVEATRCAIVGFNQSDMQEATRYITDVEQLSQEKASILD
jgi:hypothetical protein